MLGRVSIIVEAMMANFESDMGRAARVTEKNFKKMERDGKKMQDEMVKNAKLVGAVVGTVLVAGMAVYIKNSIEAEKVQAQLAARIKDTGGAAGQSLKSLNDMADAMQRATTFDDEAIGGVQAMLLTFKNIRGDEFRAATEAVLDMSVAMGTDLNSAALQMGKALNDPIKGLSALSRAGVQFSADQTKTIKTMVETGHTADAQRLMLKELESQMGTAAEAARDTLGGALKALGNSFENLLEGDAGGAGLTGVRQALEGMIATLNDPDVQRGADATAEGLLTVATAAIKVVSWIGNASSALAEYLGAANERSNTMLKNQRNDLEGQMFAAQRDAKNSNPMLAATGLPGIGLLFGAAGGVLKARDNAVVKNLQAEIDKIDAELESRAAHTFDNVVGNASTVSGKPKSVNVDPLATIGQRAAAAAKAHDLMAQWAQEDRDSLAQQVKAAAALQEQWKSMAAQLEGPAAAALYEHKQQLADIEALGLKVGASTDEIAAAQARATEAFEASGPAAMAAAEMQRQAIEESQRITTSLQFAAEDAFASFIDGSASATDAMEGFGKAVLRIAARVLAEKAVMALFGMFGGGGYSDAGGYGSLQGMGDFSLPAYGGGKASGGSVSGSKLYEVGEGGNPELLRQNGRTYLIPGSDGTVIPASSGAGGVAASGGGVKVNVNIQGAPSQPKVTSRQNSGGGFDIEVLFEQAENYIASRMQRRGTPSNTAVNNAMRMRSGVPVGG